MTFMLITLVLMYEFLCLRSKKALAPKKNKPAPRARKPVEPILATPLDSHSPPSDFVPPEAEMPERTNEDEMPRDEILTFVLEICPRGK